MKFRAYFSTTPNPTQVPDGSYIIIEADNLLDCIAKSADHGDKYFWEFEEVTE